MKWRFGLLVVLPVVLHAQSPSAEIEQVLSDQARAWNEGDIEGYMQGYWRSDKTTFVSGGNVLKGFSDVLARYKRTYGTREKMGTLQFDELEIKLFSPEVAVVTGRWELVRTSDRPWGRFTLVLERKPEGWRITYDHTSAAGD